MKKGDEFDLKDWIAKLPPADPDGIIVDDQKRKWVWDGDVLRGLPQRLHPHLNPFNGYRPKRPFKFIHWTKGDAYRTGVKRLVDANGVYVTDKGDVKRNVYRDAKTFFAREAAQQQGLVKPSAKAKKLYTLLIDPLKADEVAKVYFDDRGNVRPEQFRPFYQFICQKIASDDRSVMKFWKQLKDKWDADPMSTLEWITRTFPRDDVQIITGNLTANFGTMIVADASNSREAEIAKLVGGNVVDVEGTATDCHR